MWGCLLDNKNVSSGTSLALHLTWRNIMDCFESALINSPAYSQEDHTFSFFSTLVDYSLPWHIIYMSIKIFAIYLLPYADKMDLSFIQSPLSLLSVCSSIFPELLVRDDFSSCSPRFQITHYN